MVITGYCGFIISFKYIDYIITVTLWDTNKNSKKCPKKSVPVCPYISCPFSFIHI